MNYEKICYKYVAHILELSHSWALLTIFPTPYWIDQQVSLSLPCIQSL